MNRHVVCVTAFFAFLSAAVPARAGQPTVEQLLQKVGLKPRNGVRGQMDTVGFAVTARQMDGVLRQARLLAEPRQKEIERKLGIPAGAPFVAGISPHDDYYYAARLYQLLIPHIEARHVVIFGVFHKARVFGCRDKLVFDSFRKWHGPYGPVAVSGIRQEIITGLEPADYVVSNDMQQVEHSVEALVPFLQAHDRKVEIVSILVPYMNWETMDRLAGRLASVIEKIVRRKRWKLGRDLAILVSSDAVHYGDSQWGGSNYADFGTGIDGYRRAVERDGSFIARYLTGGLKTENLRRFLYSCVDESDVTRYLVTWCGRFSIPFGLNVASRLARKLEGRELEGVLLDYGTSVSEASLDTDGLGALGPTAPNNFHHFVGYAAIGYR